MKLRFGNSNHCLQSPRSHSN